MSTILQRPCSFYENQALRPHLTNLNIPYKTFPTNAHYNLQDGLYSGIHNLTDQRNAILIASGITALPLKHSQSLNVRGSALYAFSHQGRLHPVYLIIPVISDIINALEIPDYL